MDWLNEERASAYCRILAAISGAAVLGMLALSSGGLDFSGKPIGTDFTSFYAASKLALSGAPQLAYDPPAHAAAQNAIFGREVDYAAFFYPPLFLLICWPLALAPYLVSLAVWQGSTAILYVKVARAWARQRLGVLPILAFPAVLITLGHGQNAFLSTALLGAGLMCLDKRPVVAGVCLGALAFKPQLGIVLPFALLAARRWSACFSAGATVAALCLLSLALFGVDTWRAFFANMPFATSALEQNLIGAHKMQSVFAALQLWGAPLKIAYGAQAIVSVGVVATTVIVLWRRPDFAGQSPLVVCAALLASPFLLDYDLLLLALPLGWFFARGMEHGFAPGEKEICFAAFLLPMLSRTLAGALLIPLAPFVLMALFALVVRRSGVFTRESAPLPSPAAA